jgi:hypothetical protein
MRDGKLLSDLPVEEDAVSTHREAALAIQGGVA